MFAKKADGCWQIRKMFGWLVVDEHSSCNHQAMMVFSGKRTILPGLEHHMDPFYWLIDTDESLHMVGLCVTRVDSWLWGLIIVVNSSG